MPLYEERTNAENSIKVAREITDSVVVDSGRVIEYALAECAKKARSAGRSLTVALDGWYGVDWPAITTALTDLASAKDIRVTVVNCTTVFKSPQDIEAMKREFITDDPCFGVVNTRGTIVDLMDTAKVKDLRERLIAFQSSRSPREMLVVVGSGAAIPELSDAYDVRFYCDKTRQPLLWQMWDGKLAPFGADSPRTDYAWKEYYYCDFYLLERQKHFAFKNMDYYVEAIEFKNLKLIPRRSYDEILKTLVRYPVKEVKIFQPGPWGAYRYKDMWNVPGLECNAWNELAGPELSMLVDVGDGKIITMPFMNLIQYADQWVGPLIAGEFPGLFPMDVWLDDGYFPKPTPAERISMPIHNHPSTDYVKRHFKEPLGRYETYYIAEAYEGANTWMGFREEADTEAWEQKCHDSDREKTPIPDWKEFIANWPTTVGDLFLIPPGTTHGHGGNQMVLEMDTCPSIAGTEYSFFMYDFMRPSWDDAKKSMTGKPVRMHLEHGFDMDHFRREEWVKDHLRARPVVVAWTKEYFIDRYTSYGPMPFEIERVHFYRRAEYDTQGRFAHIATVTVGERVMIRSKSNPDFCAEIDLFQSAVIPACFGDYEYLNMRDSGQCTVVLIRWKKG